MKSFLGVRGVSAEDLVALVDRAVEHASTGNPVERPLTGVVIASLFFEPSTRTRLSFEMAGRRLGAHTLTFIPEHSSMEKGESLQDSVMTVAALSPEMMVIRHRTDGFPELAHRWTGLPVVNAGDGVNEHPTQAIADLVTLRQHFDRVRGLRVAVVGDSAHSRVAGSLLAALGTLGATAVMVGPQRLLPGSLPQDVTTSDDLDDVVGEVDVVYLLRVQEERGVVVGNDYVDRFQLTSERAARMRPEAVVMHPGPTNRGVEIADEVADGPRSVILRQVSNGVPARMAVLEAIGKGLS